MKFRPVLTPSQINHLIYLCKNEINHPDSLSCLNTLIPFQMKIDLNLVSPAYTTKSAEKSSTLDDLGFTQEEYLEKLNSHSHITSQVDIETLHSRYLQSGEDVGEFSVKEIQRIQEYRYTHDLMSPQEESEYEQMVLPQLSNLFSE